MHTQLQLAIRAIVPVISGLRALGHDPSLWMQQSGIQAHMLEDPDVRIPMEAAVDFIGRAVKETGDADLGFHLAQHAEIGSFDVFFYLMATSRTVGDAYSRLSRAQRLIHDSTVVELTKEGSTAILRHRMPGGLPAPRHS